MGSLRSNILRNNILFSGILKVVAMCCAFLIVPVTLGYLKKPDVITMNNPLVEYTDFNDNVMYEIIKIAAQMYIENTQDKRYETITNEVNTQE